MTDQDKLHQDGIRNLVFISLVGAELGMPYAQYQLGDCYLRGAMAKKKMT